MTAYCNNEITQRETKTKSGKIDSLKSTLTNHIEI